MPVDLKAYEIYMYMCLCVCWVSSIGGSEGEGGRSGGEREYFQALNLTRSPRTKKLRRGNFVSN